MAGAFVSHRLKPLAGLFHQPGGLGHSGVDAGVAAAGLGARLEGFRDEVGLEERYTAGGSVREGGGDGPGEIGA